MSESNSSGFGGLSSILVFLTTLTVYYHKINQPGLDDEENTEFIENRLYLGFGVVGAMSMAILATFAAAESASFCFLFFQVLGGLATIIMFGYAMHIDVSLYNRFDEKYMEDVYADGLFHFVVVLWFIMDIIFLSVLGICVLALCIGACARGRSTDRSTVNPSAA